jgi:hypothetical protein
MPQIIGYTTCRWCFIVDFSPANRARNDLHGAIAVVTLVTDPGFSHSAPAWWK